MKVAGERDLNILYLPCRENTISWHQAQHFEFICARLSCKTAKYTTRAKREHIRVRPKRFNGVRETLEAIHCYNEQKMQLKWMDFMTAKETLLDETLTLLACNQQTSNVGGRYPERLGKRLW